MNKQEALKQIEEQRDMILELHGWGVFGYIKGIINQLDEPQKIELPKVDFKKSQKVKVPPFVAVWYEKKKHDLNHYIWDYIYNWNHQEESEFKRWMNCSITSFQTLVNMHQFGYEVEKEKRYLVKVKATKHYISKDGIGKIFFSLAYKESFTKKELEEAGFGWVFDCPGIEIEEVDLCH